VNKCRACEAVRGGQQDSGNANTGVGSFDNSNTTADTGSAFTFGSGSGSADVAPSFGFGTDSAESGASGFTFGDACGSSAFAFGGGDDNVGSGTGTGDNSVGFGFGTADSSSGGGFSFGLSASEKGISNEAAGMQDTIGQSDVLEEGAMKASAASEWTCEVCDTPNAANESVCGACMSERPESVELVPTGSDMNELERLAKAQAESGMFVI